MDLMCGTTFSDEDESTMKVYDETVRPYHGEKEVSLPLLKVLQAKRQRRETRRTERIKRQQELIAIQEDDSQEYDKDADSDIIMSDKPNSPRQNPLFLAQQTMRDVRQIEPVLIPHVDPHPVKFGRNMLIETSFDDKQDSVGSTLDNEPLIGYQEHKDSTATLIETLDMAVDRFKNLEDIRTRIHSSHNKVPENQVLEQMRKECKT